MLIEAAKLAPRWNAELALVYERERQKGIATRPRSPLARKLVAYLMAVDRRKQGFRKTAAEV